MTARNIAAPSRVAAQDEAKREAPPVKEKRTDPSADSGSAQAPSWRDVLPVHPAANLFPMMSDEELLALGKDIKKNGIRVPLITMWVTPPDGRGYECLVDGRNRLDAMETVGIETTYRGPDGKCGLRALVRTTSLGEKADPYTFVISANIHRRHLTVEQKRDLIAKLLKAKPGQSNRQIAEQVKASHVTVGAVRAEMESTGQIDQLKATTGKDGKARTTKPKARSPDAAAAQRKAEQQRGEEWRRYDAAITEKAATVELLTPCGMPTGVKVSAEAIERAIDGSCDQAFRALRKMTEAAYHAAPDDVAKRIDPDQRQGFLENVATVQAWLRKLAEHLRDAAPPAPAPVVTAIGALPDAGPMPECLRRA